MRRINRLETVMTLVLSLLLAIPAMSSWAEYTVGWEEQSCTPSPAKKMPGAYNPQYFDGEWDVTYHTQVDVRKQIDAGSNAHTDWDIIGHGNVSGLQIEVAKNLRPSPSESSPGIVTDGEWVTLYKVAKVLADSTAEYLNLHYGYTLTPN